MAANEPLDAFGGRRVLATYRRYTDAQRAVDHLSDAGFDVSQLSIVGTDLRFVEQVTGRRGYGRAALSGAGTGAVIGLLLGWLLGLFNLVDPLVASIWLGLWGLVIGAVVGALFGLVGHAMTRGRRDFSSVGSFEASEYAVVVDDAGYDQAQRLLARMSTSRSVH